MYFFKYQKTLLFLSLIIQVPSMKSSFFTLKCSLTFVLNGSFGLKQCLNLTYHFLLFGNRFKIKK